MATYGLDRLLSNTELGLLFARLFACRSTSSLFGKGRECFFLTGIKTALFPQTLEYSILEPSVRNGGCISYENPDLYPHRNPIFPERRTPAGPAGAGNSSLPLQYGGGQRPHRLLHPSAHSPGKTPELSAAAAPAFWGLTSIPGNVTIGIRDAGFGCTGSGRIYFFFHLK